jgi:hypothetical protein
MQQQERTGQHADKKSHCSSDPKRLPHPELIPVDPTGI